LDYFILWREFFAHEKKPGNLAEPGPTLIAERKMGSISLSGYLTPGTIGNPDQKP
jgi:hypothetical protein